MKAHWGAKSKNKHPELFYKKATLKNFVISTGITCVGVSFKKNCWSKGLPFSKTSANGCILTVSMNHVTSLHRYMDLKVQGLDCVTVSRFWVRVTGLLFCFYVVIFCPTLRPDLRSKTFDEIPFMCQLNFYVGCFWSF